MEVPQKIKETLLYDPAIPFLDIHPKETENTNSKRYLHPTSTAVLFTIAKIWK